MKSHSLPLLASIDHWVLWQLTSGLFAGQLSGVPLPEGRHALRKGHMRAAPPSPAAKAGRASGRQSWLLSTCYCCTRSTSAVHQEAGQRAREVPTAIWALGLRSFGVHPKGNQPWIFIGRTDAEAEAPVLWPPDAKCRLTGKDPDAGKDWGQEEKGTTEDEMVGWRHRLNGLVWVSSRKQWRTGKPDVLQSMWSQRVGPNWVTKQQHHLLNIIERWPVWVEGDHYLGAITHSFHL